MAQHLDPKRAEPASNRFQSIDSIASLHPFAADVFCSSTRRTVRSASPFHNPQKHADHSHQIADPYESALPSNHSDRSANPPRQHLQSNQYTFTTKIGGFR